MIDTSFAIDSEVYDLSKLRHFLDDTEPLNPSIDPFDLWILEHSTLQTTEGK
jgi:hypothetical protein